VGWEGCPLASSQEESPGGGGGLFIGVVRGFGNNV
jgi:hypothetical protein